MFCRHLKETEFGLAIVVTIFISYY